MITDVQQQCRVISHDAQIIASLRGKTLRVTPCFGWQSFFTDLWSALEGPGLMRLERIEGEAHRSTLQFRTSQVELEFSRSDSAAWLQHVKSGESSLGELCISDGMLLLQRQSMAQVIAVLDELHLLKEEWIDLVVMALQWAVWQGASPERLRQALALCCMGEGRLDEIYRFGRLRILNGSFFQSLESVERLLHWGVTPALVVLGGNLSLWNREIEEVFLKRGATLIHLKDYSSESVKSQYIDVFPTETMSDAVCRIYELVEEERDVFCFPSIGLGVEKGIERSDVWKMEVLKG